MSMMCDHGDDDDDVSGVNLYSVKPMSRLKIIFITSSSFIIVLSPIQSS